MRFLRIFGAIIFMIQAMVGLTLSQIDGYRKHEQSGRGVVFTSHDGYALKITPYGPGIVRVQAVRNGEKFFADDHYEMVQNHHWKGRLTVRDLTSAFELQLPGEKEFTIILKKDPLRLEFRYRQNTILAEANGIEWSANVISESFMPSDAEHFTGLGHGFFGRASGIDLRGERIERNYGSAHGDQAPLIVPFYLSSKGYGVFLNGTFTNQFNLNHEGKYGFAIDDHGSGGRMDYFVIIGPRFSTILDRYTQLTGRPRFPPRAVFGIGLSDKGNDENSKDPSDENWWKKKITEQRDAGLPIDHLINDNRWRAGGGKRCESIFEWDNVRYPDPAEYKDWLQKNGLMVTLDFNRCIGEGSEGWKPSFNVPYSSGVDHPGSVPDFTRPEVRNWFWELFWKKSLDPALHFPGDALWIDEFDELGPIADTVTLGNGRAWGEMKNYWPFLIAKSLVQEGWDKTLSPQKRPFVWVRGMTAGAQRYATLWTGDIQPNDADMANQVIALQLAGLSGFPYEGHDAGGFYDWNNKEGPDENLYQRWSMALGCFTPFWKPHGWGQSRWPLDRSPESIETARKFSTLRYALMPYTYTIASEAAHTGVPMARAMIIDNQDNPMAWKHGLQYMWGSSLLVAPNAAGHDSIPVWLPAGTWFDYWTNRRLEGDTVMKFSSPVGGLVLFAKEGAIIPRARPALSTALIDPKVLEMNVYTGRDGTFTLYEDDGVSEKFKKGSFRETKLSFRQDTYEFEIGKARGTYDGAPIAKSYVLNVIGSEHVDHVLCNGKRLAEIEQNDAPSGFHIDGKRNVVVISLHDIPVSKAMTIRLARRQ